MKITKRQLKRIIRENSGSSSAQDSYEFGSNAARQKTLKNRQLIEAVRKARLIVEESQPDSIDVDVPNSEFPITVGYQGRSELVYNQDALDDLLDYLVNNGVAYSLDSTSDIEPDQDPIGARIEQLGESEMISYGEIAEIIERMKNEGLKHHDRSRKTRKAHSKKLRRKQGKEESEHPTETEDTGVMGMGDLFKGPRMKTPSQLSYGLDYGGSGFTGGDLDEVNKIINAMLAEEGKVK